MNKLLNALSPIPKCNILPQNVAIDIKNINDGHPPRYSITLMKIMLIDLLSFMSV